MTPAEETGQAVAFPRPGEPFEPAGELPGESWWRSVSRPVARPWRPPGAGITTEETRSGDLDLEGER